MDDQRCMVPNNGYNTYSRTDIQTSDPRAVVVLLYEGAIRFLNQGIDAVQRHERMEMSNYIQKAQKIITYLNTSLDYEAGGEIAINLGRLYNYMRDRLAEANLHCDISKMEEVITLFKPLLEAWREIAKDPAAAAALEKRALGQVPSSFAPPPPMAEGSVVTPMDTPVLSSTVSAPSPVVQQESAAVGEVEELPASPSAQPAPIMPSVLPGAPKKMDSRIAGRAAYGLR